MLILMHLEALNQALPMIMFLQKAPKIQAMEVIQSLLRLLQQLASQITLLLTYPCSHNRHFLVRAEAVADVAFLQVDRLVHQDLPGLLDATEAQDMTDDLDTMDHLLHNNNSIHRVKLVLRVHRVQAAILDKKDHLADVDLLVNLEIHLREEALVL